MDERATINLVEIERPFSQEFEIEDETHLIIDDEVALTPLISKSIDHVTADHQNRLKVAARANIPISHAEHAKEAKTQDISSPDEFQEPSFYLKRDRATVYVGEGYMVTLIHREANKTKWEVRSQHPIAKSYPLNKETDPTVVLFGLNQKRKYGMVK